MARPRFSEMLVDRRRELGLSIKQAANVLRLREDVLIPLARRLSTEHPDAPGTTPFDEEATCALMEPHLEGNRQISERYLDGEPLFSEEYEGRPVWVPNEERIAECRAAFEAAIAYVKAIKAYDEGKMGLPKEFFEFATESLRRAEREDEIRALKKPELAATPKATAVHEQGQEIIVLGYAGHSPILGEMYLSGTFVSAGAMNLYYKDGETGRQMSFTLVAPPVPGAGSGTFHIGFALPEVRKYKSRVNQFEVSLDGKTRIKPEKVMDVDQELRQNMDDERNTVITRTAVRVILRTIAAQKAKEATNTGNGIFDLLKNIAVDVGQTQLEQADLRVGLFLPNSFHMTRIPVQPGSHDVNVAAIGPHGETVGVYKFDRIAVRKGQKVLLIVPAIK